MGTKANTPRRRSGQAANLETSSASHAPEREPTEGVLIPLRSAEGSLVAEPERQTAVTTTTPKPAATDGTGIAHRPQPGVAPAWERQHAPNGTFTHQAAETIEWRKNSLLTALNAGETLGRAVELAGISYPTLWRMSQQDDELGQAMESWRRGLGVKSLTIIEDTLDAPGAHEEGLKHAGWSNFAMFTAKSTFPDMRDNTQVNVNVGVAVGQGDWQAAIKAIAERPAAPSEEGQ